jgi:hypothetical protein
MAPTTPPTMTPTDWIVAVAAVLALGLSIRNTIVQHRDRTPRVEIRTYWVHPSDAPMVIRGTANPVAPAGTAIYRCDATNVGAAGVKITQVPLFNAEAFPGKPVPLQLPEDEAPKRLENGDSQTWFVAVKAITKPSTLEQKHPPRPGARSHVVAMDAVGNSYQAKEPAPYPYHRFFERLPSRVEEGAQGAPRRRWWEFWR